MPPLPDEVLGRRDGEQEVEAVVAALGKRFVKEECGGATAPEAAATHTSAMTESKAAVVHAISQRCGPVHVFPHPNSLID
jgi:hypothetical protein